jgi:glycerol kinase
MKESPGGTLEVGGKVNVTQPWQERLPFGITQTEEEARRHWFVGSIDQGTTSSRFLIFNGKGDPVVSHQIEFRNQYPEPG